MLFSIKFWIFFILFIFTAMKLKVILLTTTMTPPFCWVSASCDPTIIYGPNFFIERRRSVSQSSWYDQCFTHDEESIVRLIGSRSPFQMGCKFVVNLFLLGLHSVSRFVFFFTHISLWSVFTTVYLDAQLQ